jgi:hypothetical protein
MICALDPFVQACADAATDDGTNMGPVYEPGDLRARSPAPRFTLPDDVDWKSIDQALMYELLSFPNQIENAKSAMNAAAEFCDPDDMFDQRQRCYMTLGFKAEDFAKQLRQRFQLPARSGDTEWDPVAALNKAKTHFAELERRHQEDARAPDQTPPTPTPTETSAA